MVRITSVYVSGRRISRMQGKGGSVLLNQGGAGAGSSYDSVDEYIATTGRNPMSGSGALSKKLESLSLAVKPQKNKIKNIKFNL
jgi:hypothetical protein